MTTTDAPALEMRGLTKTYGSGPTAVAALRAVDVAFPPGTFTAVMGPSGSGKSTFLACAAGLDRPTGGQVLVEGVDLTARDEVGRTMLRRERIGFVFQDFSLVPYLTAAQNVELPLRLAGRRADARQVAALLAQVGLADRAEHLPSTLSGGQQQRVAVARALVTEPGVVLADEPTGALDTSTARSVLRLLRAAVDTLGRTVVMVTHDPVAAACADAVVFLVDGRLAGRLDAPTPEAVAARTARLEDLVPAAAR